MPNYRLAGVLWLAVGYWANGYDGAFLGGAFGGLLLGYGEALRQHRIHRQGGRFPGEDKPIPKR